ncbi:MAG: carboxypeptidase-like regulatory domain-containing protein [Salinivirgaceae bacterium]
MRVLYLFFFSLPLWLYSQELFEIKGIVNSKADSLPLAYAHIGIPSLGIGTVSNIYGEFRLQIECEKSDSLQISYLGYKTIKRPVVELLKDTVFYLEEFDVAMEQINIIPQETLKDLFKKAVKAMPRNYASQLHYAKGFYRETQYSKSTNEYTRLLEVAFNMQDRGIKTSTDHIRMDIEQLRKSDDFSDDTFLSKALAAFFPELFNFLYGSLKANPIRTYYSDRSSQKTNVLDLLLNDTSAHWVLLKTFSDDFGTYSELGFSVNSSMFKHEGTLVINQDDFALVRLKLNSNLKFRSEVEGRYFSMEYKNFNGVYLPIYIIDKHVSDIRKDGLGGSTNGISINKLVFTDYYFKRSEFERIKRKFDLKNKGDVYNHKDVYDAEFWNNYNMLLEEPLNPKVIQDLEKGFGLNEQFQKNSL